MRVAVHASVHERLRRDLTIAYRAALAAAERTEPDDYEVLDYVVLPVGAGWPGESAPDSDETLASARAAGFRVSRRTVSLSLTVPGLTCARQRAACAAAATRLRELGWGAFHRRLAD